MQTHPYLLIAIVLTLTACNHNDEDDDDKFNRHAINVSPFFTEDNLTFDDSSHPQGIFTSNDTDTSRFSDAQSRQQLVSLRDNGTTSMISYLEAGNPEGDPIILVHGTPSQAYLWRNVIPQLPQSARIIAPDLIGYGQSSKHDIDYSFKQHAAYIHAFIVALALVDDQGIAAKKMTFVAHDIGAVPTLAYASRFPDNIKGMEWARNNFPF